MIYSKDFPCKLFLYYLVTDNYQNHNALFYEKFLKYIYGKSLEYILGKSWE